MSRFMDARGRFFGKVNVVDVIVLLVIVAVVAFAVVRTTGDSSTTIPVTVTYYVEEQRQVTVNALVEALQAKGTVRDDGGTVLGKLVSVEPTPTREQVPTANGELRDDPSPIYSDITIVVQGQGRMSGSTVRIGSVQVRVGKKVTLIGTGFEVQTIITGKKTG
jgi:hypothetical protein